MKRLLAAIAGAVCFGVALCAGASAQAAPTFGNTYVLGSSSAVAGPVSLFGQGSIGIDVSGTFSGQLLAQCQIASTWVSVPWFPYSANPPSANDTGAFTGYATCPSAGAFRVVFGSYVSGTAIVQLYATSAPANSVYGPSGNTSKHLYANLSSTVLCPATAAALLLGLSVVNTQSSTATFVQVFDAASAGVVTLGTTVPNDIIQVGGGLMGFPADVPSSGLTYANGICLAATTAATGSSGSASGVYVAVSWK